MYELNVPEEIDNILYKDYKKFKSIMLDFDYEIYGKMDNDKLKNLFLYSIVDEPKIMKKVKKKLMASNINEKKINTLFYTILKFYHKFDTGVFSFNEAFEWNLEHSDIKKTTTKYTLI